MGQIIQFPGKDTRKPPARTGNPPHRRKPAGTSGELVFFTGVRYERGLKLPAEKLRAPVNRV